MVYDPVSQGTGAYFGGHAYSDSKFGGGGTSLSPGERRQNQFNDVQRYLNSRGGLTDAELALINEDMSNGRLEQLTPEQRLARYETLNSSQDQDLRHYLSEIMRGDEKTFQQGYDTFKSMFGRAPSSTEWAQLVPIFGGAEGQQRGNAAIAQMFEAYKQSPEYLRTQAGQYSDELDPVFDQLLGRDFSSSELDYFGQQLAGGRSMFEIEQMLKQSPEYQQAEDKRFRTGLASELEGYDTSFFNKAKENVISRGARAGGGVGTSSALDFALTNLMGEIAEKRGQYLAGLSSSQYAGNKDAARADYTAGRDRYFGEQEYDRRRRDSQEDYYRDRADDDRDYQRQFNDMMAMQNRNRGGGPLHTRDWIGIGLGATNTAANAYGAFRPQQSPYSFLDY